MSNLDLYIAALSSPVGKTYLEQGLLALGNAGFNAVVDPDIYAVDGFSAGSPAQRYSAWCRAVDSGRVIVNARGGYGSQELLQQGPLLQEGQSALLLGASDTTVLQQVLWLEHGQTSLYSGMPAATWARANAAEELKLVRGVLDSAEYAKEHSRVPVTEVLDAPGKEIEGVLRVGCLSLWQVLATMGFDLDLYNSILVVEDVGEHPFRIRRMLNALLQSGQLAGIAGMVFGQMPGCEAPDGAQYSLSGVLAEFAESVPFPVWSGAPVGHVDESTLLRPLWNGRRYRIANAVLTLA